VVVVASLWAGCEGNDVLKLRRSTIVLLVLTGLLGVSNVAMAEHEESHPEDTWFNFGYDPADHFLAVNIDPNDLDECDFQSGLLHGTYLPEVEGVYEVELEPPYDICLVRGVVVAGPNGQINHGQFMKAAKSLFDVKGHGCLVRELAKSNIGKGNDPNHLTVSEAESLAFEFDGAGTTGDIDFTTVEADCNRGKKDKETATANASNGRAKGKSADAPGHNK